MKDKIESKLVSFHGTKTFMKPLTYYVICELPLKLLPLITFRRYVPDVINIMQNSQVLLRHSNRNELTKICDLILQTESET
jgi:hypothetical protein